MISNKEGRENSKVRIYSDEVSTDGPHKQSSFILILSTFKFINVQ